MVFCEPLGAMLAYYGLHHVLVSFDLMDEQRAALCAYIDAAAKCARAGGYVLFPPLLDLPDRAAPGATLPA